MYRKKRSVWVRLWLSRMQPLTIGDTLLNELRIEKHSECESIAKIFGRVGECKIEYSAIKHYIFC